jgi:hypothetical protein
MPACAQRTLQALGVPASGRADDGDAHATRSYIQASAAPDRERTVPLAERTAPLIGFAAGAPSQ